MSAASVKVLEAQQCNARSYGGQTPKRDATSSSAHAYKAAPWHAGPALRTADTQGLGDAALTRQRRRTASQRPERPAHTGGCEIQCACVDCPPSSRNAVSAGGTVVQEYPAVEADAPSLVVKQTSVQLSGV